MTGAVAGHIHDEPEVEVPVSVAVAPVAVASEFMFMVDEELVSVAAEPPLKKWELKQLCSQLAYF